MSPHCCVYLYLLKYIVKKIKQLLEMFEQIKLLLLKVEKNKIQRNDSLLYKTTIEYHIFNIPVYYVT